MPGYKGSDRLQKSQADEIQRQLVAAGYDVTLRNNRIWAQRGDDPVVGFSWRNGRWVCYLAVPVHTEADMDSLVAEVSRLQRGIHEAEAAWGQVQGQQEQKILAGVSRGDGRPTTAAGMRRYGKPEAQRP